MPSLSEFAALVGRLAEDARRLDEAGRWLRLRPLAERGWFELIVDKLLPQLSEDAYLIVAVVGGTNTGKTVVFNHLAGTLVSGTSPIASGTKHPVCLIPSGFAETHSLANLFSGFELRLWESLADAQRESAEDRLYWHESPELPGNLLLLDTPDIDSDAQVNWRRAKAVRRSADLLVATLTQQKYNDAAVKQFFRTAAAEAKTVMVIFNQCQLPEDEAYWPQWLRTFCEETGVEPAFVYLAPHNRAAAEELALPFWEQQWPSVPEEQPEKQQSRSLQEDLSRLRFEEIKIRSLSGALRRLIDPEAGVGSWLDEITSASASVNVVAEQLSAERMIEVRGWPTIPFSIVFEEFWTWWRNHRTGWTRNVASFYDVVNEGIAWPVRQVRNYVGTSTPRDPVEEYRAAEQETITRISEDVFDRLSLLAGSGGGPARHEFAHLCSGENRRHALETISRQHEEADLRRELAQLIARDMQAFLADNPRTARWLKRIDVVAVGSRPALSAILFAVGAHGVEVAAQGLVNIGIDFLAGSAVTVGGDTAFSKAAGSLGAALFARLRALPAQFAEQRAAWLAGQLREHALGTLPDDLQRMAVLPQSETYQAVESSLRDLERLLESRATQSMESTSHARS